MGPTVRLKRGPARWWAMLARRNRFGGGFGCAGQLDHTVLLGSSQILMLQRVRETLAGRAIVFELWPLMASELVSAADDTRATGLPTPC